MSLFVCSVISVCSVLSILFCILTIGIGYLALVYSPPASR